jgi:hypothetical protein
LDPANPGHCGALIASIQMLNPDIIDRLVREEFLVEVSAVAAL